MITEVLSQPNWKSLYEYTDPTVLRALESLPVVLAHSREAATQFTYIGTFNRFERWARKLHKISVLPASKESVAIYLLSLAQDRKSISTLNQVVYAISWMHRVSGFSNPTSNFMVQTILDGVRRLNAVPITKKLPITPEILESMYTFLAQDDDVFSLKDARFMCFSLLSFAGFLRFDEASVIRRPHISFFKTHLALDIPRSKTDPLRHGNTIVIAKTHSTLCPVAFLKRYLFLANIHREDDQFIFRNIFHCVKTGERRLTEDDKSCSYSVCRDALITVVKGIGLDPKLYSLHSFRAGGATSAAKSQVPDRLFKNHGRWRSECCKDSYVEESLENKLFVTMNLGL